MAKGDNYLVFRGERMDLQRGPLVPINYTRIGVIDDKGALTLNEAGKRLPESVANTFTLLAVLYVGNNLAEGHTIDAYVDYKQYPEVMETL